MQKPPLENNIIGDHCDKADERNDEIQKYLREIKDLTATFNVLHQALKVVMINASILPVVYAAEKDKDIPKKPPKMKYKDLPLYKTPHYEYKEYIEEKHRCPDINAKVIQRTLFPIVHKYRTSIVASLSELKKDVNDLRKEIRDGIYSRAREFKAYMRHPDNLQVRQATVAFGTIAGLYLGSGTRGVCKKIIFATVGAVIGGSLCFPKDTDKYVRDAAYCSAKFMIALYNFTCKKNFALRERIPCPDDLPPPPAKLTDDQINKKCKQKK